MTLEKHVDEFWELMEQIAGNKIYGEFCRDFDKEELLYTQRILADKYQPLTALVDTLVGFFRESMIVIAERMNLFQGDKTENFHYFLLLRSTMLRAQAVRKLLTSGYNAEAIGLTRSLWEIFELLPALRKNVVTFEEWLGGKTTQDDLLLKIHEKRKFLKKKQFDFSKKLKTFRNNILKDWIEEEKDQILGWIDIMHRALHRNQLEFAFSKNDLEDARLSISIQFEERRVQSSLNIFIFTLYGLLKDLSNSPIFPNADQAWFHKYEKVMELLGVFCRSSPMGMGQLILKYIDGLVAMKAEHRELV